MKKNDPDRYSIEIGWKALFDSLQGIKGFYNTEEDKVVKFRPVEAPDTGDKARKFKKLFA